MSVTRRGRFVVLAGPDGTGKTSLAGWLAHTSTGSYESIRRTHWTPGMLPRPGAVVGRSAADPSAPHSSSEHSLVTSAALLVYHWIDFFVGGWTRLTSERRRGSLILAERWWWDVIVDPRRYRLRPLPRIAARLGRLLPDPDVVLLLSGDASTLRDRKAELGIAEIERQLQVWRTTVPASVRVVTLDAGQPLGAVGAAALQAIEGSVR